MPYVKLNKTWQIIDGSDPAKKNHFVDVPPGVYELEAVSNPFGFQADWFVIKGTMFGATKGFWRDWGPCGDPSLGIIIIDDLPLEVELTDPSKICPVVE